MRSLIIIYSLVLGLGIYTWRHSEAVLNSIVFESSGVLVSPIDFSEGQTKQFPDYRVQPAISIQSTVGIE